MRTKKEDILDRQNLNQENLADQTNSGSIEIRSIEALKGELERFPNNWSLLNLYANTQKKKGFTDAAADSYAKAAEQSLKADKILLFLVLKISQWRISPPKKSEAKRVITDLRRKMSRQLPLSCILNKLSFHEIIAFFSRLSFVYMSTGQALRKVGDLQDSLYFVATGTLRDSILLPIENNEKVYRKPTVYLTENDFFGDIYPFEKENRFKTYVESMDEVVLVKVPKIKLIQLCHKYPNIESGLVDLFQVRRNMGGIDTFAKLRRLQRFILTRSLSLTVISKPATNESFNLKGITSDISISGLRFILDEESYNLSLRHSAFLDMISEADVQIKLSIESMSLDVIGKALWSREVSFEGRKTLALGVQFKNLSPNLRGILVALINGIGLDSKNL